MRVPASFTRIRCGAILTPPMNESLEALLIEYKRYKGLHLNINMSRGQPCKEQLDLSMPLLDVLDSSSSLISEDGFDCRNYGVLTGLEECKKLFGDILKINPKNIIIRGNSSLSIMFDCISHAMTHGILGYTPWMKLEKPVKWLCPVPGYDRHFAITEYFGIEMINIPMKEDGPDMDLIEDLIQDDSVKGVWCVPQYSNPSGITYSDEVVRRFARLKPAAKDFRIYWDDAYAAHHLYEANRDSLSNILEECEKAGNPDLVYHFVSTSKITFPGSGVSLIASSEANIQEIMKRMKYQIISFDKINQLRHVRFFHDAEGVEAHMKKHAAILRPKFELAEQILQEELQGLAEWSKPKGGYFICLYVHGHAKEVIQRCRECGIILTDAGCAFPYHKDPDNSVIRIAPSCPSLEELEKAMKILCLSVKIETKQ